MDISCRHFLCQPNACNSSDNQARPMADHYAELPQLCSYAFASNHDYKRHSPLTYISTACEISKRLVSQIMGLFFIHPWAFKHNTSIPTKNYHKGLYTNERTWQQQGHMKISTVYTDVYYCCWLTCLPIVLVK